MLRELWPPLQLVEIIKCLRFSKLLEVIAKKNTIPAIRELFNLRMEANLRDETIASESGHTDYNWINFKLKV